MGEDWGATTGNEEETNEQITRREDSSTIVSGEEQLGIEGERSNAVDWEATHMIPPAPPPPPKTKRGRSRKRKVPPVDLINSTIPDYFKIMRTAEETREETLWAPPLRAKTDEEEGDDQES